MADDDIERVADAAAGPPEPRQCCATEDDLRVLTYWAAWRASEGKTPDEVVDELDARLAKAAREVALEDARG